LGGKLSDDEKKTIEEAADEAISWLDSNKDTSADEIKERKKELESKVHPIISKLYAGAGGEAPPAGEDAGASDDKDEL
jgi:molecular chaperone DnaK (HSP70)